VVNKSDHPMAMQLQREIRSMLEMLHFPGWVPELVATQAIAGTGIDKLWSAILSHERYLKTSGEIEQKRRAAFAHRVRGLALGVLERRIDRCLAAEQTMLDPYTAAREMLARFGVRDEAGGAEDARAPAVARATVKGL
jgi:putative protein kinase ArgK-like GTPase of G3E family